MNFQHAAQSLGPQIASNRQPELLHQIAPVHMTLPKQSEVDGLETLRHSPTKFRLFVAQFALPSLLAHENYARPIIGLTIGWRRISAYSI